MISGNPHAKNISKECYTPAEKHLYYEVIAKLSRQAANARSRCAKQQTLGAAGFSQRKRLAMPMVLQLPLMAKHWIRKMKSTIDL